MNKLTIFLKLLSVNKAWQGRRYKTLSYKMYEKMLLDLLPEKLDFDISKKDKYSVSFIYGFTNELSDIDNPTKLLFDIMQKKYGFNDCKIYELYIVKKIVKKGEEFVEIDFKKNINIFGDKL